MENCSKKTEAGEQKAYLILEDGTVYQGKSFAWHVRAIDRNGRPLAMHAHVASLHCPVVQQRNALPLLRAQDSAQCMQCQCSTIQKSIGTLHAPYLCKASSTILP